MGLVYEAEQERPQRRVAVKIVRPGVVPEAVLRRFEREYEFLGRLQHPGIAQIYQAGVAETPYGPQPYFAMELVKGRRLDEYVRATNPPLRERLLLVASIADAVQHAHERGIIHRDLKPANILVNASGEPKVLDFGIARAARDAGHTGGPTAAGEVLGTLRYMSPEQIAGDPAALDTRTDVYSLGVLLYEVLAGRLPYDLDRTSLGDVLRTIREEEPLRLRLAAPAVPADVETIVEKALEKDKERRYHAVSELADDLRRFLRDEPITARPASAAYQVRKFARRHKAIVAGVLVSLLVLIAGVVTTSWQAVRARRAELAAQARAQDAETERAKAEAATSFLTQMLTAVDPAQARGRDVSVREALDAAAAKIDAGAMAAQPAVEIAVRNAIGTTYGSLGLFEPAERQLRASVAAETRAGAGPLVRADTQSRLVAVLYPAGKLAEATEAARESLALRRASLDRTHVDVAESLDDLGAMLMASGDTAGAEPLMRESLAIRRARLPAGDPKLAVGLNNLGYLLWRKGSLADAEAMYREALSIDRRALGDEHPEIPLKMLNLAVLLRDRGRSAEAEVLATQSLAIRRRILGPRHPVISNTLDVLAGALEDRGENSQAEAHMREALSIARDAYGDVHRETVRLQNNLGWLLWKMGRYTEAEPLLRAAVAGAPKTYGPAHRVARLSAANLAHNQNALGRYRPAETIAREVLERYRQAPDDHTIVTALLALGQSLIAQRRAAEAIPYLREALAEIDRAPQPRFPWFDGELRSVLGEALAAQGQVSDADPLLVSGYERLERTASTTPFACRRAAIVRLVAFYTAGGRPDDAAIWQIRLRTLDASKPTRLAAASRRGGAGIP
jgi:tetratricopeptide (TPR) repeat protein